MSEENCIESVGIPPELKSTYCTNLTPEKSKRQS
jgi:hypothetical protein